MDRPVKEQHDEHALSVRRYCGCCFVQADHFRAILVSEGLDSSRIDLLPLDLATGDHLSKYNLMDISLDPFPYAGV